MTDAETCAADGCDDWPEFPDAEARRYCRTCYPEPNDGEFTHVPAEYRDELKERYEK